MISIDMLKEELAKDVVIDQRNLQSATADNPKLYSKWLGYLTVVRKDYKRVENKLLVEKKNKYDFYSGRDIENICEDVYDKTEIKNIVIPAVENIQLLESELEILKIMIDFINGGLKAIQDRGYSIKNIVELRKIEAGM